MLDIYGKPTSINVRKVLWLCEELALDYTLHAYGSGFASVDTEAFRALNPNALVPVIRDGDLVLWESNTICRYLAARAGRADLLPTVPAARALVEQWMDWQATELNNAWRYAFMASVRGSAACRSTGDCGERARVEPAHGHPRGTAATRRPVRARSRLHPGRYRVGLIHAALACQPDRAAGVAGGGGVSRLPEDACRLSTSWLQCAVDHACAKRARQCGDAGFACGSHRIDLNVTCASLG
ncbi:glutathione S-transferase [Xanthomonas arboricola]